MATDLESKKGVPKYEAFVESQLAQVRTRMRALDAGRSLLMLGVATLAYFLLMAGFDLAIKGSDDPLANAVRITAFGLYSITMVYLVGQLALSLYRRINPYYVAKQLEETIPDAKNSVINWLDLKGQEIPGAIRNAVGQRAARELKHTNPDKAVDPKGNWVLLGILVGLTLGLLILFALGPNQFGSLLQRAFTPFFKIGMNTRTVITLIKPAGGDSTVPLNQRVEFQARIEGRFPTARQPGSPRLLYRYQIADPFVPLVLEEAVDGTWSATLLGDQVQNGFWYKIAAGDTETPEYQIKVQSLPQATCFEATYHYRPYRKLADDVVIFPNEQAVIPRLKDYRGTEVQLVVRTNRLLRAAHLEMETTGAKRELPGEILADDPKAFAVRMTLEQRGTFRVFFTSKDGEENTDHPPYSIEVLDDLSPSVVLTKPGQDISLPAWGMLAVEGTATDDIGLTSLRLMLKILEGDAKPALRPKVYREGKSFQFEDGTFPDFLEYKDFVALDKLATIQGQPFPLKAGMVLEYWLEAKDNSDYPNKDGNVGKSQAFKLTIIESPKDDRKKQEEIKTAEDQQKQHEQKQDQQTNKEHKKRNENQGQENLGQQDKQKKEKDFESKLQDLEKKEKELKQKEEKEKSGSKGQETKPAENKAGSEGDNTKAEQKQAQNPGQAGEPKEKGDQGQKGQKDQPGQTKGQGAKEQNEKKAGEPKGQGEGEKKSLEAKDKDSKANQPEKGMSKEQPKDQPSQAKNEGKRGPEKTGESKGGSAADSGSEGQSKGKPASQAGNGSQAKGDNQKTGGQGNAQANNKGASKDKAGQAQSKEGQGSRPEAGQGKDGPSSQTQSQGQAKGNEGGQKGQESSTNPKEATAQNINDLKDKLKSKEQREQATEDLNRMAKEAQDPNVRKAAQELLDKLGQEQKGGPQPQVKDRAGPDDQAAGKPKADAQRSPTETAKGGEPKAGESKAKGTGNGKDSQEAKGETKSAGKKGDFGPGGQGATDDVSKQPPNPEFANKGGVLQLEELKKRMTPETLKKIGWTEAEWRAFLQEAKEYQEIQQSRQTAKSNPNQRGNASQLPGTTVRVVDRNPKDPIDPLQVDRALTPPEFRDAQRQFTTSPSPATNPSPTAPIQSPKR